MFKRLLIIFLLAIAVAAFAGYFYYASKLAEEGEMESPCTDIKVVILDSLQHDFVNKEEVRMLVNGEKGKNIKDIDTYELEKELVNKSAIASANLYVMSPSTLTVVITQRQPVMRLQLASGSCYVDKTGYILPLLKNHVLDIPIVTGNIPFNLDNNYRGYLAEGEKWIESMLGFTTLIQKSDLWQKEIEQINIEENGDIALYTKTGDQKILFGSTDNAEAKINKMGVYFSTIVPQVGLDKYKVVNLKYNGQIICK